jgi:hypothetical protein
VSRFDQGTVAFEIKRQLLAPNVESIVPKNNLQAAVKAAVTIATTPYTYKQTKNGEEEVINREAFKTLEGLLERSIGRFNYFYREQELTPEQALLELAKAGNVEAIKMLYAIKNGETNALEPEEAERLRQAMVRT